MLEKGWRFPLSLHLCRAIGSLDIGAFSVATASDNAVLLSDFHPWPVGKLEQREIQGAKIDKRGRRPKNTNELINCINQ